MRDSARSASFENAVSVAIAPGDPVICQIDRGAQRRMARPQAALPWRVGLASIAAATVPSERQAKPSCSAVCRNWRLC